jgi:adenine deaminase
LARGANLFDTLRAACVNPVRHYQLPIGQLQVGDPADFIAVDDLVDFTVRQAWIGGREVAHHGQTLLEPVPTPTPNCFAAKPVAAEQLRVRAKGHELRAIVVHDGQLVTSSAWVPTPTSGEWATAAPGKDLLKLVVYNRYEPAEPALAFVQGFGLQGGALASTVAHDSHNIIAVGADDAALAAAINALVASGGGISLADAAGNTDVLPLPIAGLMSDRDGWLVAEAYETLDAGAKALGSTLKAPYMSLSFLALLVIPSLKLSDRGLFDGEAFAFCDLFR